MNYRHLYHAGNFADVFKHIILVALIQSFLRKEKAFCYLDTHAGIGEYDLNSKAAQVTKEYENGILKILSQKNPPDLVKIYLQMVKLPFYPGSPLIVKNLIRSQDRMILSELHSEDYQTLKQCFLNQKQINIHQQDGYQSLKAYLPPKEKRGLILIDPPYEKSDEFSNLLKILPKTLQRFETGCYAIWYPIKNISSVTRFKHNLQEKISRSLLNVELTVHAENLPISLNGCGMIIINPPWKLKEQLEEILPWISSALTNSEKNYICRDLTNPNHSKKS